MRRRWLLRLGLGLGLAALLLAAAITWVAVVEMNRPSRIRGWVGEVFGIWYHDLHPPNKEDYPPKLDGILGSLVQEYARIGPEAIKGAPMRGPEGDTVLVTIYGYEGPANMAELTQALRDRGISADSPTENCWDTYFCDHVYVPLAHLLEISQLPAVFYMEVEFPFLPLQGGTVSKAVLAHGADTWQVAGYTGQGIKVGIIDSGFGRYEFARLAKEVSTPAAVQCKEVLLQGKTPKKGPQWTHKLSDCDSSISHPHGTAVAEALFEVAPAATVYLAESLSREGLREAVDWLVRAGGRYQPFGGLALGRARGWHFSEGQQSTEYGRLRHSKRRNLDQLCGQPQPAYLAWGAESGRPAVAQVVGSPQPYFCSPILLARGP